MINAMHIIESKVILGRISSASILFLRAKPASLSCTPESFNEFTTFPRTKKIWLLDSGSSAGRVLSGEDYFIRNSIKVHKGAKEFAIFFHCLIERRSSDKNFVAVASIAVIVCPTASLCSPSPTPAPYFLYWQGQLWMMATFFYFPNISRLFPKP